jgi:tubulin polyglutamylase TTLL4
VQLKEEDLKLKPLYFKVTDSAVSYNCFINAFLTAGFEQTSRETFNVVISGVPKPDFIRELSPYQKTNHFPGIWQLGRKDNLWRNMLKMRRKFGKVYEFCPYTYLLPEDFSRLQADRDENPKSLWILKPSALSCGRGIKVLSSKSKLSSKKTGFLVSKYLANPHLINGFKYDLRIYVGVNSFDPLRVFVYKEGLVRFATEKYSTDGKSLKKRYVHLTNFSVNKNSKKFVKNTDPSQDGMGSKWSLKALRAKYLEIGIDYDAIFRKIEDIVIKTMIAVEPHVVNALNQGSKNRSNCFETYGFDILIDSNLTPWLLEVNVCPSLASSSPLDRQIKTALMCDIFTLSNIVPYDRSAYEKEVEFAKSSRLYGLEKQFKSGHRNLTSLLSCEVFENYSFSAEDLELLADCEEDPEKNGDFKLVFPVKENIDFYSGFFDVSR